MIGMARSATKGPLRPKLVDAIRSRTSDRPRPGVDVQTKAGAGANVGVERERQRVLPAQRVEHLSSSNKVDDFVFGIECVDDSAQARLSHLSAPLTSEN